MGGVRTTQPSPSGEGLSQQQSGTEVSMNRTGDVSHGWNFNNSPDNESVLKPLCEQVEQYFPLPTQRLYRYFATTDEEYFRQPWVFGEHYRGALIAYSKGLGSWLHTYLLQCFFADGSFANALAFDTMIYVRYSTCFDVTGCVTTYAHELQHFVQYRQMPKLLVVNQVLRKHLKQLEPTAIATDVPSEREANIVSKRVAEKVCGVDAVRKFAEEQIRAMREVGAIEEADRWIFFQNVGPSTDFNLLEETIKLVEIYKGRMDFGKIDVNQPESWLGPLEDEDLEDEDSEQSVVAS
jgi:hypothetical protein